MQNKKTTAKTVSALVIVLKWFSLLVNSFYHSWFTFNILSDEIICFARYSEF